MVELWLRQFKESRYHTLRQASVQGDFIVTAKTPNDSELQKALRVLLSDIEEMYQGAEPFAERRHPEEFFGPFSVGKLGDEPVEADISVSWPNLAISMRNAREALGRANVDNAG